MFVVSIVTSQDVEVGVLMLYELGEAAAEESAKAEGAGPLVALVTALAQVSTVWCVLPTMHVSLPAPILS